MKGYITKEQLSDSLKNELSDFSSQLEQIESNSYLLESQKAIRLGIDFTGKTDNETVSNNTIRLQKLIDELIEGETLILPRGVCCINKTINITKSCKIVGYGDNITFHLGDCTTIVKVNGDVGGDSVVKITGSNTWRTSIENIVLQGCFDSIITYYDAHLTDEANSKCTSYGLFITDTQDCIINRVGATQCKVAGIYSEKGAVHEFNSCVATQNFNGSIIGSNDGSVNICHYHHNIEHGLYIKANYTRVNNCRFEWNGKNGIYSVSGENQFIGNLFDRNGYAGLSIAMGWGHTVVGNYFSRNGCSGDGTIGRWNFSSTTHPSYNLTPEDECCHIKLNYQRDVTISGNRYRSGKDDSGEGANTPCCIYYCINAVSCNSTGEAGLYLSSGGHGGYTTHDLYESKVEKLTTNSNSLVLGTSKINSIYTQQFQNYTSDTITIPFDKDIILCKITLLGGKWQHKTLMSEINIISRRDGAYGKIDIVNKGNLTVTNCARSGDDIVITLSESVEANVCIMSN